MEQRFGEEVGEENAEEKAVEEEELNSSEKYVNHNLTLKSSDHLTGREYKVKVFPTGSHHIFQAPLHELYRVKVTTNEG